MDSRSGGADSADADFSMRVEHDSMGKVEVPATRYWGAQTQRALTLSDIGDDLFPTDLVHSLALIKKAAASANAATGRLDAQLARLITSAADEIAGGMLDSEFPLKIWMSGSGTPLNMNVNEVIANRANEMAGSPRGSNHPVHPHDHVNMSQSANDVLPSAMHVAVAGAIVSELIPVVERLRDAFAAKAAGWADTVKVGRTHLQDAVPITLGQEFSGYAAMLDDGLERIRFCLGGLYRLPLGGTAVGTGLNTIEGFAEAAIGEISAATGLPFLPASNRFAAQGAHDALLMASGVLRTLAGSLHKIANDIRLLASGPRAGLFEILLPANEPGSSFMPGKVNPTQCEALAMVAVQVMGYDTAVGMAGASGHLEMNAYKPLIALDVLQSVRLLCDGCRSFTDNLVVWMRPNVPRIEGYVADSLMLVTALVPVVGYEAAAGIARSAFEKDLALREAAIRSGLVDAEQFDRLIDARAMTHPAERGTPRTGGET